MTYAVNSENSIWALLSIIILLYNFKLICPSITIDQQLITHNRFFLNWIFKFKNKKFKYLIKSVFIPFPASCQIVGRQD